MSRVLIIDDNPAVCSALAMLLKLHKIETEEVYTPKAGLVALMENSAIDLVIQDMNFTEDTTSGKEGITLFHQLRKIRPDIPVILLTAWTQLDTAIELVRSGAADYIGKPWEDQKLVTTITNLLELAELQSAHLEWAHEQQYARAHLENKANLCGIIYQSIKMQNLLDTVVKIAPSDVPVLVTGPNGSGKEKIAEIIQANSRVASGPFIRVNIGALPNELIQAELFGAEAGAYTGISKRRIGRFEAADGGTLFLDELGNLSANGQAKLLRILQTGEYERLGSSETRRCNVRVISATNIDLSDAIRCGEFRQDLYYRLNVIEINVPPLNERKDDILPLAHHFLVSKHSISPEIARSLQQYSWPGNVRELENACKRAPLLNDSGELSIEDFSLVEEELIQSKESPRSQLEPSKQLIEQVLRENKGVVSRAARQLGLTRQALYRRIEKYDI